MKIGNILQKKKKKKNFTAEGFAASYNVALVSYISQVFHMPPSFENKINELLVSFIVPHKRTLRTALDFSLPRQYGGYGISNVVLHLNLCLIKPIMLYMQERMFDNKLS